MQAGVSEAIPLQKSRRTVNANRPYMLACVILTQCIALVLLLRQDDGYQRWRASFNPPKTAAPVIVPSAEPRMGMFLKNEASSVTAPGPYLLIPVKNCASCIAVDIKGWITAAQKQGVTAVFLASANREQTAKMQKALKVNCPVIYDPGNKIAERLNAQWAARAYLFSKEWRLSWKQKNFAVSFQPFEDAEFLHTLQELK